MKKYCVADQSIRTFIERIVERRFDRMSEQQNIFGSTSDNTKLEFQQNDTTTATSSAFSKFSPEKMVSDQEKSAFFHAREEIPEHITGSDRKRGRRAMHDENSLDDILGQCKLCRRTDTIVSCFIFYFIVTAKLNTLSTNEDEKKEECTKAFIEVLGCSNSEASFYLESSAWDLEAAVVLWLESNTVNNGSSSSRYSYNDHPRPPPMFMPSMPYNSMSSSYNPNNSNGLYGGAHKRYQPREVIIAGLPVDWRAEVNADNGIVQFVHIPTGVRQNNVPPGYADADEDDDGFNSALHGDGYRVRRNGSGDAVVDMTGEEEEEQADQDDDNNSLLLDDDQHDGDSGIMRGGCSFPQRRAARGPALHRQASSDDDQLLAASSSSRETWGQWGDAADTVTADADATNNAVAVAAADMFEPQPEQHYFEGGVAGTGL